MSGYYLAVAVLAALNLASIVLVLFMWMRLQRLEAQIRGEGAANAPSPPPPTPDPHPEAVPDKFSSALMGGEMSLRQSQDLREPPEKYRFVGSLADQGMDAGEIAKALHLSRGEVEQILTLERLGRRDAPPEMDAKVSDGSGRQG